MPADQPPSSATSTVERVRPGKTTQQWAVCTVADLKGGDALTPVTLIAPTITPGDSPAVLSDQMVI